MARISSRKVDAATSVAPRLLSIKAASEYLSCKIWFLRTLVWNKKISYLRAGHSILFDIKDLDKFIDQQKVVARA